MKDAIEIAKNEGFEVGQIMESCSGNYSVMITDIYRQIDTDDFYCTHVRVAKSGKVLKTDNKPKVSLLMSYDRITHYAYYKATFL